MELLFWSSVGLTIIAVISVAILIIKFYNLPNPLTMLIPILGSSLVILITFLIYLIARGGAQYKEEEAEDVPGSDLHFDYGEPPYNSYKYN
jgi:hypothetical protein